MIAFIHKRLQKESPMKTPVSFTPAQRLRRLRQSSVLRQLVRETTLTTSDLIYPIFVRHGQNEKRPIISMPDCYQWSCDRLAAIIDEVVALQIPGVILFGIPATKDSEGQVALSDDGLIQTAVRTIKAMAPHLLVITDVCFCEYTDHGHCGVMRTQQGRTDVDNDATLQLLANQAVSHARAGADIVAPSGMMDGMVGAIRAGLDANGFYNTPILSYSAKYASSLYSAFRVAVDSAPSFGDRKSYQMDYGNSSEALRETALDVTEGADMLMVKPAVGYLDVLYRVKQAHPGVPVAAYSVGGEYAMVKAAAACGWIDENAVLMEQLVGIKRAGADFIITYFALAAAGLLQSKI
jgi:porphobilinogen synthase